MLEKILGLFREEEGQGATEYGLMVVLVVVVVGAALLLFKNSLSDLFTSISDKIDGAVDAVE
ncbi:MAG: Flp family type IVb pilin [Clostridiaceae bacterium]